MGRVLWYDTLIHTQLMYLEQPKRTAEVVTRPLALSHSSMSNPLANSATKALSALPTSLRRPTPSRSVTVSAGPFALRTQYNASMATTFLTSNGLEVLVTSHSVNDHGFRKIYEGAERDKFCKVYSLFSASCFCNTLWNKGIFFS